MSNPSFKNKKITVMGLGLHGGGVAVVRWLNKFGAQITLTDLKTSHQLKKSLAELRGLPFKSVLGRHRRQDFVNKDLIIQNPAVPANSLYLAIARSNNIPIENEASLFFKMVATKLIIGITGTRGKSTTTSLAYRFLKSKYSQTLYGGNIRTKKLFEIIDKIKNDPIVLELSSFQLENLNQTKLSPHLAVITNILPDHLNRYRNLSQYIKAKKNIINFQDKNDFVVLNLDNQSTKKLGQKVKSQRFWFSRQYFAEENGTFIKNNWLIFRRNGQLKKITKVSKILLPGQHNLENILAAVTVAMIYKVPLAKIRAILASFTGITDRLQLIGTYGGVKFYNDTTATIPEATIAALDTLGAARFAKSGKKIRKNIILIAGGSDKNLKFVQLAKVVKKYAKVVVLLAGSATPKIYKELTAGNKKLRITKVKNMPEAVLLAKKIAVKGDIIILSPACASFGLFQNEFDRGEQFVKVVKNLKFKI